MKTISLNGAWTLNVLDSDARVPVFSDVPATVPGSVYHDLLAAGRIDDPFWRDNENEALKLMDNTFVYARKFNVPAALLSCDRVLLCCHGLDTLAEIFINGRPAGRADNMHRTWEYDVSDLLSAGENAIEVRFSSPTRYIRAAYAESRADGSSECMVGFPLLRKAHCMFGWDWGPRLPDAGIWRDIELIGIEGARIEQVRIRQHHESGRVTLRVSAPLDIADDGGSKVRAFRTQFAVTAPDGQRFESD